MSQKPAAIIKSRESSGFAEGKTFRAQLETPSIDKPKGLSKEQIRIDVPHPKDEPTDAKHTVEMFMNGLTTDQHSDRLEPYETALFSCKPSLIVSPFPFVSVICNDTHGQLIHYVKDYDKTNNVLRMIIQNLTDKERNITIIVL